jgi:transcriptional regulator with XRE-family HTH domain
MSEPKLKKPQEPKKEGKGKRYRDIADMIRQVVGDGEFVEGFEEQFALRAIITDLMALRAAAGLSQQDIAEKLGCTQGRISKLESSNDGALRIGDLAAYAGALGFKVRILLTPVAWAPVDEVKYHAFSIKRLLEHLARLAGDDASLVRGVGRFFGETAFNVAKFIKETAERLPNVWKEPAPQVSIEVQGVGPEQNPCEERPSAAELCPAGTAP